MENLAYDPHQFYKVPKPVSSETRLTFDDYDRMGTMRCSLRNPKFIPAWANNDKQIRHVLAQRSWQYLGKHGSSCAGIVPEAIAANRALITYLVDKYFQKVARRDGGWDNISDGKNHEKHVEVVSQHGGFLALQCAVIYRAYRLGQRSPDIAEELGVTRCAVRQWLLAANQAARVLGYETFPARHHTFGGKCKWIRGRKHVVKSTA